MDTIKFDNSAWRCPKCGEENNLTERFCRKCGFENGAGQASTKGMSGLVKILIAVFLIILLAGGGFLGFQYWKKRADEKAAGEFLVKQQEAFGSAVKSVNEIYSEKDLGDEINKEDNKDIVIKKFEEEKIKAEKASAAVKASQAVSVQNKGNKLTAGMAALLESFYASLDLVTAKYSEFIAYGLEENKVGAEYVKMNEKFESEFKSTNMDTIEKVTAGINARKELEQKYVDMVKALNPPAGLAEYENKYIELQEEYVALLGQMEEAFKKKDYKKVIEIGDKLDDFKKGYGEKIKKINEIWDYYFSQMHDEFVSARGQADKIKTEFITTDPKFNVVFTDIVVEGW